MTSDPTAVAATVGARRFYERRSAADGWAHPDEGRSGGPGLSAFVSAQGLEWSRVVREEG